MTNIAYRAMGYPEISSMIYYEDDNTNTPLPEYVLTKVQYFDLVTGYDSKLFVEILIRIQLLENRLEAHKILDELHEMAQSNGEVKKETIIKILSQDCNPQQRLRFVNAAKIIQKEENEKEKLMSN